MPKSLRFASGWLAIFLVALTLIGAQLRPPASQPAGGPAQPLQAWTVAPDGAVFVVDAAGSLYQLDPASLTPIQQTAPLLAGGSITQTFLLADAGRVYLGSQSITTTFILNRPNLSQAARLNRAGPMAADPGHSLLMIASEQNQYGYDEPNLYRYNLANLAEAPQILARPCILSRLWADPGHRRAYFHLGQCDASPPHRRTLYGIVDLDAWQVSHLDLAAFDPGVIDRPALAAEAGKIFTLYHNLNDTVQFTVLDLSGQILKQEASQWDTGEGQPVTDPSGTWLYTSKEHWLVVRRTDDFLVQSMWPFTTTSPADIALSPGGETLYLFGNGWLTALAAADLQKYGTAPVSPLPSSWLSPPVYLYPSPTFEQDQSAFVLLSKPGEYYRSSDGGASWSFLATMSQIKYPNVMLSLSPNFNHDQSMLLLAAGYILRSNDGGQSWSAWQPRIAFTSDREGNRELYTMTEKGEDILRLTNSPAGDENAAWSPAWSYLAFQSNRSGNWDIFTLRADCPPGLAECELAQLTDSPGDDMLPAWSPDGRQIAFVSTRDGNPEIYLMDRDGQNQRRLTFNDSGDWRPAWLPDSRHLLFSSSRSGNNDIYRLTVPASLSAPLAAEPEITPLITDPADDRDPAVGSNGTIFFLSNRAGEMQSYGYRLAYDNRPRIEPASQGVGAEGHPSPFNSSLGLEPGLLISLETEGNSDIYLATPYSSRQLTTAPGFEGQPAGGPVWWQPDPAASLEWLSKNR